MSNTLQPSYRHSPSEHGSELPTFRPSGNTILITGGGSGIGRELALRLHAQGNTVIVTGRRLQALQQTVADRQNMHAIELDIDDPAAINAFAKRVVAEHPALNVLFNNAGIMRYENLGTRGDLLDAEAQISTNLLGPIRLTNALVDHLRSQPDPAILNVSSGLAFVPRADAAVYSATKAAIHIYTMGLRQQLAGQVKVMELVAPAIQTDLTPGQSTREGYMPLSAFIDEVMALLVAQPVPDEIVVERALAAGEAPIPGVSGAVLADSIKAAGHPGVTFVEKKETLPDQVLPHLQPGDLVVTLGAGDIWKAGTGLLARLAPNT